MMRLTKTLLLTLAALAATVGTARADFTATVGTARADFTATASLSGANERPKSNGSSATGFATVTSTRRRIR